jgi:DNA-binding CsgD family transcriptional regulator
MRNRLAFAQTKLSGDSLRSCVENLSEGVLCFSKRGQCVFVNAEALRALSLPETSSPADVEAWMKRSPLSRLLLDRLRLDPLPKEPRWLPPVAADITGRALRFVALVVPTPSDDGVPPVFHVFVVRQEEERVLPAAGLSDREAETVRLIVRGLTYGEAAVSLGIGEESVRTYAKRAFAKLGVASREGLLKQLMRRGSRFTP